jgi:hypothetical protein
VAQDMLFATLDPTLRTVKLPDGRPAMLSDTVGFISDLPHELVEAFRATLEEVQEADVVLHVRDIASPDSDAQKRDVRRCWPNSTSPPRAARPSSRCGTRSTCSTKTPAIDVEGEARRRAPGRLLGHRRRLRELLKRVAA